MFGAQPQRRPFSIPQQATQAAYNNVMAQGDQQAAARSFAGQGLSRGRGQQYMDSMRGGAARAGAQAQAMDILGDDAFANAGFRAQALQNDRGSELERRRIVEQRRVGELDSRFENLTSIWGALAGLLR